MARGTLNYATCLRKLFALEMHYYKPPMRRAVLQYLRPRRSRVTYYVTSVFFVSINNWKMKINIATKVCSRITYLPTSLGRVINQIPYDCILWSTLPKVLPIIITSMVNENPSLTCYYFYYLQKYSRSFSDRPWTAQRRLGHIGYF